MRRGVTQDKEPRCCCSSPEQQHFQWNQSLKVPAPLEPSSLFVLYVCFWRSFALTSRTLSRFIDIAHSYCLFIYCFIIVMASSPEWFTCAGLVPYLFPYFLFFFSLESRGSAAPPASAAALVHSVCLNPQKTFGTLHEQHISTSISPNLCILLGRAAGFCTLVRAAERVKRTPHNSVYFPRAWPIKGLHFCRFPEAHVKLS